MSKLILFIWLCFIQVAFSSATFAAKPSPQGPQDLHKISTFIADYNAQHAKSSHTPGWTFAFAQGNKIQVQSFGVRNVLTQAPVDGNTVFRIASVSKVFVAVAVQQLLETHQVQLDEDISVYLPDFPPLKNLPFPVTLRQLMTHTAGFEDKFYGDSARQPQDVETLEAHLAKAMPAQIHQPGEIIRYSNYGNALAALVVESVSGVVFHDYVQQRILTPSGMVNSGYMLTDNLKNLLATGYRHKDGELQARPYTWVHRYPPTSMLTTANDMAKFIAMLINGGLGENARVLSPASVRSMFSTHFSHDSDIPGMALGWMEFQRYGNNTLFHDGGTPGYVAQLVIIPAENAGYFIAANQKNSDLPGDLRYDFLKAFFDKSKTEQFPVFGSKLPLSYYTGYYQNTRRNHTSYEAFAVLMSREVEIQLSDSGNGLRHWDREYLPYALHKFVHAESGHKLIFKVKNDEVEHLALDWGGAPRAYKKIPIWQQKNSQGIMLAGFQFLSLLVVIIALLLRAKKHTNVSTEVTANALLLVFFVLLAAWSLTLDTLLIRLAEIDTLKVLLALPVMALAILIVHLVQRKFHWLRLLAMAPVLAALIWLQQYNLVGWWF